MGKNKNGWLVFLLILIIPGGLVLSEFGLFSSIDTGTRISVPNADLKFSYQEMTSGCVVRLEKTSGSTTWVGVYDNATFGAKNADATLNIGWINQSEYTSLVNLLKDNPPTTSCILSYMCNSGETKCNKWEYQTCINGNWTLTSPSGCIAYYNPLNDCNGIYIYPSTKTANDYSDLGVCLSMKNAGNYENNSNQINQTTEDSINTSEGLSKVLFSIGSFDITILMILIIIGVIILIFLFK